MATCSHCDGSGRCQNGIHDRGSSLLDEAVTEITGGMYTCDDCGEDADSPGECVHCGGTGEI